ncbi:MAG: histidine--tRNA ligase [Bdellovibrionales bacterium]|nr:histidine--tRNA ligase [Bdellovibrionales bacterium]
MIQSLKGMPDILPKDIHRWHEVESTLKNLFTLYSYEEIRTPLLESTDLFSRSVGTGTDIVEKEMYTFVDRNGDSISLRPEGTASVVRAYNQHHLGHSASLVRLYYMGPMFRHERPQKGRYRQFFQVGIEALGKSNSEVDAEVINILYDIGLHFKLESPILQINSVGDYVCRTPYQNLLSQFLVTHQEALCETCQKRITTNPMRVFDCKNSTCQEVILAAPLIFDHLCKDCLSHFEILTKQLDLLKIPYVLNKQIVRGLDYYTRTAFEMTAGGLGSQNAVGAGGRYDLLVEQCGGEPTPAVGFALGMERLLLSATNISDHKPIQICILPLQGEYESKASLLAQKLRSELPKDRQISIASLVGTKSIKAGMRQANKMSARYVILLGENEVKNKSATLKNMTTHGQQEIEQTKLVSFILGEIDGK